jgi:hypothetical protein
MPTTKLPACCGRKQAQITFEKGALLSAARKAAARPDSARLQDEVTAAKVQLAAAVDAYELHIHDETWTGHAGS